MSKHFEGPWDLGKSIQQYFLSEGGLTTHKANLITREHGLDIKNVVLGRELLTLACTLKQKDLSFKM